MRAAPDRRAGEQLPTVSLTIPARAENMTLVRKALGGLADSMRLENGVLTNMKVAVTEACTNVVVHAYDGEGDLQLEISPAADAVLVVVRDEGAGFRPLAPAPDGASWRLGVPLMASMTDALEIGNNPNGQGTEVRMTFSLH